MKKTTLLYVDDEEINLLLFERSFGDLFRVVTASSGAEGLDKLDSDEEIEIVISDMRMLGMNGVEFISKAKEQFPSITYFILTGFAFDEAIENALKTHLIAEAFTKPFSIEQVCSSISRAIENR